MNNDNSAYIDGNGHPGIDPQSIEMARTNRECWAVEDFPEGNWGEMKHGCQLSLRLDKQVYTNGEVIKATVLVRHVTNDQNCFVAFHHSNKIIASSINYLVYKELQPTIAIKPSKAEPNMVMPSSTGFSVLFHTQRKYKDVLNGMYDLTNGIYYVQASVKGYSCGLVPPLNTNQLVILPAVDTNRPLEFFELESAKVRIQVK